jgi:CBS domain-containing protein
MTSCVSMVLKDKGHTVVTVGPTQDVATLVALLTEHRIGAAPVVDETGRVIGIVSERDIIRGIAKHRDETLHLPVSSLMTRLVKTCAPDDTIVELMEIMTRSRIRHLPVVENGALSGIVSIGDVVKQRLDEAQFEVEALRNYITA